jgi:hypothetical protein
MILDKLEYIVALLAGLGVAIGGFAVGQDLPTVLLHLFIALVVFYIIGLIIRIYLRAKVFPIVIEDDSALSDDFAEFDEEGNPILAQGLETNPDSDSGSDTGPASGLGLGFEPSLDPDGHAEAGAVRTFFAQDEQRQQ